MTPARPWWIPGESPGVIGDPEIWVDAVALDHWGGIHPDLVRHVLAGNGGGPWVGQQLRFGNYPHGAEGPDDVYLVTARRHSQANCGRPYYVARRQDDGKASDERAAGD